MGDGNTGSDGAFILEVLGEAGRVLREIELSQYMRIGRGSDEFKPDVVIPDECTSTSRQHAVLDLRGGRPVLEDKSRFGTIVNGTRVEHTAVELSNRDEIIFGSTQTGWRVRFRVKGKDTEEADPLELLSVLGNPRQVRIGHLVIEENLGRDAFHLLEFLSENKGSWYPTGGLVDMLWSGPDGGPLAPGQALARCKRAINDLLRPHLEGQDAIVSAPFRGYRMKPGLDDS